MGDEEFDDGRFVTSWILMDFPFGPRRETALDYFEAFFAGTPAGSRLQPFVDEARRSRLGLHQFTARTKEIAELRELFTGRVTAAFSCPREHAKGEILLARTMTHGDRVFVFGTPKGFLEEAKTQLEDRILSQLFYFDNDGETPLARYEVFMKLAGPYWMSCLTKNADVPFLAPDHYRAYLDGGS